LLHKLLVLTAFTWLAACVPNIQTAGTPYTAPVLQSGEAVMADAARLPMQVWHAKAEKPRAIIIGVHGMNDYANAFASAGAWFAERGITLYAYDQRGFGRAPGRGIWAGAGVMKRDLQSMIELVRGAHPGIPLYVIGTSMGGAVTLTALADPATPPVDGAVLVAPAVWGWSNLNLAYSAALWLGAHTLPGEILTGRGLEIRPSDNIDMLKALAADPLVIKGTRIDAVYGLVNLMEAGYQAAPGVEGTPVLLLYGAMDEIVPPEAVRRTAGRLRTPVTAAYYANGYHMLLRDLQAERVWQDIEAWISGKRASLPSGEDITPACFAAGAQSAAVCDAAQAPGGAP